jgi:peptidoglycan hydrolase-like protein with peptidoglycan-binding domain
MNLEGRDLQHGLTGSDVGTLQSELTQLSYSVPSAEQQASSFGDGTLAAVKQFQTDNALPAAGVVNAATAAALSSAIAGSTYVVNGAVSSPVTASVMGLTVQLVDKNVGGDVALASTTTGAGGTYSISTVIAAANLKRRNKTQPDLQARVASGGTLLATSAVAYSATLRTTLNVLLPANVTGLQSEYEALTAGLASHYTGQLSALEEGTDRQDITFLANKSGWDARAVALAALASQFSQLSAPPLAAPQSPAPPTGTSGVAHAAVLAPVAVPPAPGETAPPPANVSLQPEFYYALFRAGVPAETGSLFRTSPDAVQAIWQQALTQGVIPQALANQIPVALSAYQALSTVNLLTAAPAVGVSTLGNMLTVSKLSAAEQSTFSQLSAQYGSDPTTFWNQVSSAFGASVTKQLQLDGQMFNLTLNNAPLVSALYAAEPGLVSPLDLVTRGYYDPAQWVTLIGATAIPAQIPGQTPAAYASYLAAQLKLSYPTAVAGDQVKRGVFPVTDAPSVSSAVATFLTTNYDQFFIGAEAVEAFIARNGITGVPAGVVPQIKRLQRTYQLTADDQSMAVLLRHNIDSAFAVTRYGEAGFLRAFAGALGTDGATKTFRRAQHVYSAVMNVALGYLSAKQAPSLGGTAKILTGPPSTGLNATVSGDQPYPVVAYPTLESLFGSLDYCTCDDCNAILSPAAYLVDLLNYVDQPAPTPGFSNPQSVLLGRRPDLQYLPLTCENTNTALPYIDIVNETLEYFVANGLSLAGFTGYSTDDTVTSAQLIASPQFTNNAAYSVLQSAFFPPPLPFNRPLAQLRQLFSSMGVDLPDVMAALRTSSATVINQTGTAYSEGDVCLEYLGISRDEYRLFTDGTLGLPKLYGYPGTQATVLAELQNITLEDFSRRTGVSYSDLVSILGTQFINPNAILIERLERLGVPFSTLATLNSTPSTAAAFIASLPAGLDARAYGGSYPEDDNAVVAWVTNAANFADISGIITLANPTSNPDECAGSSFAFRYLNGNPLSATDFTKLIRFIRLWQKLGLTIEQTDDLLSALYPAADLPTGGNDTVNLPLLDAGFTIALPRMGVLFAVMELLSITANQALGQLLGCWAPIDTVGDNALYQQMFGGPTLEQEDPGAPIATVGGSPNAGDIMVTQINSVSVSQSVSSGDLPTAIAANIASAINATTTVDTTTALPLNQRIFASSAGPVVTIRAGFTLAFGPAGAFTQTTESPLEQSLALAIPVAAGQTLTASINSVKVSYTMAAGDTPASVAASLATAINGTDAPDPYSGLPLNSLLVATSLGSVTSISSINSGAPLALACSITEGTTGGSYVAGSLVPAFQTATVGGTVANGDVLTTTINSLNISFTVAGQTTAAAVAAAIVTAINGTTAPDPVSGMPVNAWLSATSSGGVITLAAKDPATSFTLSCTATGGMTYAAAGPFATSDTATVASGFPVGTVLTTTINGVSVTYTTTVADTPSSVALSIAAAIDATTAIDPVTNVPLNQLVKASAAGAVITVTVIQTTGTFALAVSAQPGTYVAGTQPAPFADNGYGEFLADLSQTVFGHEPALRAAFNLTGAEFTLIASSLEFTSATPLTLENISSIFRVGWLAHTLGLSVLEFLLLREMTGLDPFAPLDRQASEPVDPPVLRFIRQVQALSNAGLAPVAALYLLWNQDISGKSTPDLSVVSGLAVALRAAYAAVAAQFTIQSDPDGSIAQSLMALVYGTTATDFYFGLLSNTLVTAIDYPSPAYPNPQPAPLQAVIDATGGRLSYDGLRKQLSFAGVFDAPTQAAIQSAITTYQNVPALTAALGQLVLANQQMVGPFFTTYPELLPLYSAFERSTSPLQQKRTTLLSSFLPTLISKRNVEQALATVTAASGNDPSFASVLLEDPTILHAATDGTAPIVRDLTALNNQGLAAQIFLSNSLSGAPDMVLDADPVSYAPSTIAAAQTATISGTISTGDVLTTVINGVAVPYTVTAANHTVADVAAGVAAAIEAAVTPDPFSGLPLNNVVSATALRGTLTVQALNAGGGVAMTSAVTPAAAPPTYTPGTPVPASGSATVAGAITVGDTLTTTINTIAIPYTVVASDTSLATLAAHIASAINAIATADPASGLPLNQVVTATSGAGVVTVAADFFGPDLTLACAVSGGASETYTAGALASAAQTATLSGLLPANDQVITTINSVAVSYIVAAGDTTLSGLIGNVAAAINASTTVDAVTGQPLNTIVHATSAAGMLTVSSIPPGVPFTLSLSLGLGNYTLSNQVTFLQTAAVSGGIAAGDVLSTTINGITVTYTVTGVEAGISAVAAAVVAAIGGTAALAGVVSVTSAGGILIFREAGSLPVSLTCSVSLGASISYTTGPQFPAWQATISGGFSAGDVLTTNVNDGALAYTIGAMDTTPAAIAADIATKINASTTTDPLTGLPLNQLVSAVAVGATILFRFAGPAVVLSCAVSAGATEHYVIGGELPAKPAGGPVAGIWSGYLDAPQDGFYNIEIDTDPGATVTLSVGGTSVVLAPSANASVWSNQSPISLTAGALVSIELTVTSLVSALSLNWQSAGLGWQSIPAAYLYSGTLMDRLETAYVRYLKVTSLATGLSLTADEIAFLGTSPNYAVNTSDTADNLTPGTVTFTPASMGNIVVGSNLVIDTGALQESVTVTAATATTFTATTANPHNGTVTPFPIVDAPSAATGQGWLNLLAVSPIAGSLTAALTPPPAYTTGAQTQASQTATIGGTVTAGNVLTTTLNGIVVAYTVAAADTLASIASGIAAAINRTTALDPQSHMPLNQVVSATASGAGISINAVVFGTEFSLSCSVSAGATETYVAGAAVAASQTLVITGRFAPATELVTTFNSIDVPYTVTAADTTPAILADHVATAINATTTLDTLSNLPLNSLVKATAVGNVITLVTVSPGGSLAVGSSVASLRDVLRDALNFARIKAAISPNDEQVLGILEDPALLSADGVTPQIVKLTGWSQSSLNSLLLAFFGSTQLAGLGSVENLRRVFDAFAIVTTCRISAAALLAATTNAPTPATVAALQSALRALYAPADWLNVIQPTSDALRIMQRDALVAYILQQIGDQYAQAMITLETVADSPAGATTLTFGTLAGVAVGMGIQAPNVPAGAVVTALAGGTATLSLALTAAVASGSQAVFIVNTVKTTADTSAGSSILTLASTAGLQVNMGVSAAGIPANALVSAISGSTVTLSAPVSSDVPPGSLVEFLPSPLLNLTTANDLLAYFLFDVETQPPVQTSRIRLALSSVQLFIERCLRNLEAQVEPTDIDGALWTWMSRYRVWQANREVFLWPENWLYPELRDDQSPLFQQMMSSLLQSDITDDAAASAYLDYLSGLEAVAKLEPCGLYYAPAGSDTDETSYVVGRTAGAHRKYYFRELQYGSWTPWTEMPVECEDLPVTPIVWNGRLMLFWLKISKTSLPQSIGSSTTLASGDNSSSKLTGLSLDDMQSYGKTSLGQQTKNNEVVSAVLYWSEYYNGKWQAQKSSDVHRPTAVGAFDSGTFDPDRNLLAIVPVNPATLVGEERRLGNKIQLQGIVGNRLPSDALVLAICQTMSSSPIPKFTTGGFVLYNTHSLPIRWEDVSFPVTFGFVFGSGYSISLPSIALPASPGRTFSPIEPYTGGTPKASSTFGVTYWTLDNPGDAPYTWPPPYSAGPPNQLFGLNRVARTVDAVPNQPDWYAPFFFEDRKNVFYVTSGESEQLIFNRPVYGFGVTQTNYSTSPILSGLASATIPVIAQATPYGPPVPIGGGDPAATELASYLAQGGNVRAAINSLAPVSYQGVPLYPGGQFVDVTASVPPTVATTTFDQAKNAAKEPERGK